MIVLAAITFAPMLRAQRADSSQVDSIRAHLLQRVVIAGARLATATDARLPIHVERIPLGKVVPGASPAAELLQRLPGISASNDQGNRAQPSLDLRGFSLSPVVGVAQGVSVFLDGVRINEPDAQEVHFDLIPIEAVESAELLTGASAVLGKNTLGGALNLQTVRGRSTPGLGSSIEAGSFGERVAHLRGGGQLAGLDGVMLIKGTTDDGYQAQSGTMTRQLFTTIGHRSADADIAASFLYAHDKLYQAGSLPESWIGVARRANYTGGDFFRPELMQLSVRGTRPAGPALLRATAFVRRNAIEQFNVNVAEPSTRAFIRNESVGATTEVTLPAHIGTLPVGVTAGAEATHARVHYRVFAEATAEAPEPPADCESSSIDTSLCENARVNEDDAGIYLQSIVQATKRVSILLSARGDFTRILINDLRDASNSGTSIFWRLSPKLGITKELGDGSRLYASVGSAFRAPAPLELACASPDATCPLPFSLGADPPLDPVVAWNYEFGADWSPRAGTTLSLSLFESDVHDEIAFVSATRSAGYFQNIDRTRRDGLQAAFSTLLPTRATRLFGSYAFIDATYRSATTLVSALDDNGVQPGNQFALSPRHRATLGLETSRTQGANVLGAMLSGRAVSSAFLRGDEANRTSPLPGYAVADLRLSISRDGATLSAFVANALDRNYAIFGAYATNPKGAYMGSPPAAPSVERFLTPAYPRTLSISLALER